MKFWPLMSLFVMSAAALGSTTSSPPADFVVATWSPEMSKTLSAAEASSLLSAATTVTPPPMALLQVRRTVQKAQERGPLSPDMTIVKARLLQQQHQFEEAAQLLIPVVNETRTNISAMLLLATIQLNLGQYEQAEGTCKRLFSAGAPNLSLTCLIDAQFQKAPDEKLYDKLNQLSAISSATPDSARLWVKETLASMALHLNKPDEALQHINAIVLEHAPVSTVDLWARIQFALNSPSRVFDALNQLVPSVQNADDALLLNLAMAEKRLERGTKWQSAMADRVALRIWREDFAHAGHLARYYLDVESDREKALKFARLNAKHAQSFDDRQLLARATNNNEAD